MDYFVSYSYNVQGVKGFRNTCCYYQPGIRSLEDIRVVEDKITKGLVENGGTPFSFGGVQVTIINWKPFEEA